jgi:hypothetical protein
VHHMHLGPIVRILPGALLRAPRMDVLPDPHAPEPVATLDADAPVSRPLNEIPHRAHDLPLLVVDPHCIDFTLSVAKGQGSPHEKAPVGPGASLSATFPAVSPSSKRAGRGNAGNRRR